ncbi:DNA helicase [Trifolium repens]|nr:DNA helicase [Trifolium repens]
MSLTRDCICLMVLTRGSYSYMDGIVNSWNENGILKEIMQHKLVFIETRDVVETTLALDNYRKVCDCGRGAIFFSVAR